ncbi:MAG: hypothetical protein RR595_04175 [Lysinibacillus sp.]
MSNNKKENDDLKGTFYAVMGLGVLIIVVWIYCFNLFMDRF